MLREQRVGERRTGRIVDVDRLIEVALGHGAREREAVRLQPSRCEREQDVAVADRAAVDHVRASDDADDRADHVELARGVHPRHLGGLAAEQRDAGRPASVRDAADDLGDHVRFEPGARDVVEEEQRPGALHQHVVHAVVDEVAADAAHAATGDGDARLGADAVRRRDEHRALDVVGELEEAPEGPEPTKHLRRVGGRHGASDPLHGVLRGVQVDAGGGVRGGDGRGVVVGHRRNDTRRDRAR